MWLGWAQVLGFDSSPKCKGWSKCNATKGGEEHFVTSRVVVKWIPAVKLNGDCGVPVRRVDYVAGPPPCSLHRCPRGLCMLLFWGESWEEPEATPQGIFTGLDHRKEGDTRPLLPPSYSGSLGETPQPGYVNPFSSPWCCGGRLSFSGLVSI